MKISISKFQSSFIPVKDNYFLELETGKTYVALFDEANEVVTLIEPLIYEENLDKLNKKVTSFIEKIFTKDI